MLANKENAIFTVLQLMFYVKAIRSPFYPIRLVRFASSDSLRSFGVPRARAQSRREFKVQNGINLCSSPSLYSCNIRFFLRSPFGRTFPYPSSSRVFAQGQLVPLSGYMPTKCHTSYRRQSWFIAIYRKLPSVVTARTYSDKIVPCAIQ